MLSERDKVSDYNNGHAQDNGGGGGVKARKGQPAVMQQCEMSVS